MSKNADPWDFIEPMDTARMGNVILDSVEQQRWSRAVMLAGSLPYMWKEKAGVIRDFMYGKLELRPGDKVLVLGEMVQSCGFDQDLKSRVGASGEITVIDITDQARDAVLAGNRGAGGQLGTWSYEYTRSFPDEAFDCVAVLQAVQHAENWAETGRELLRVMKRGRVILLAEITFSPRMKVLAEQDIHISTWIEKLSSRVGFDPFGAAYYSAEELARSFSGLVHDEGTFVWRGIELFWGRKS
jgi:ubiquinone/menaquinone biosynthesis C-methylase UbiE